jgi:hypothetical protein
MSKAQTASEENYFVRRLRPEDAEGVVQCVRGVYGDSYLIHTELYHPEQIVKLNETGYLISVVALDANGKVVGHYALERPHMQSRVAESGEAMVLPEHQHHHLLERMRVVLEEEGTRLSLSGIFGRTVTNHVFSQKAVERFGERPCGVSLGRTPKTFHNTKQALPQRMSIVFYFKYLRPTERVLLHVPEEHREICTKAYRQFGVTAEFAPTGHVVGSGQLETNYHDELLRGKIFVSKVGRDTSGQIEQVAAQLLGQGAEVIFLDLPAAQAGTQEVCLAAEEAGFFFCGMAPDFFPDGDAIRMQCLHVEIDISLLQIENPFARELLAYVEGERRRVGGIYRVSR